MNLVDSALRGAQQDGPPAPVPREAALVVGAGGALGSALLAQALVAGRFLRVAALTSTPLATSLRGLVPLAAARLEAGDAAGATLAFVVFERARFSNRRDEAFVMPAGTELPALAAALRRAGVRRLVVVVPHAPALLPHSLRAGFASHDEAAVAALGFDQLVFVRAAQSAAAATLASRIERFVAWWFSQLRWMVPEREQPLRAVQLAELAVRLAGRLPLARPGTRVLAQDTAWALAREAGADAIDVWLGVAPSAAADGAAGGAADGAPG
jgi:hypothetical protein